MSKKRIKPLPKDAYERIYGHTHGVCYKPEHAELEKETAKLKELVEEAARVLKLFPDYSRNAEYADDWLKKYNEIMKGGE